MKNTDTASACCKPISTPPSPKMSETGTAIMSAAGRGNSDALQVLIELGANLDLRDPHGVSGND